MKRSKSVKRDSGTGKPKRTISRRRFIRDASAGAAGIALASTFPGLARSQIGGDKNSTVVIARHPDSVLDLYTFDQSIVGELVNSAITELTGQEAPGLAWAQIFPDLTADSIVGIKVNCFNTNNCCSRQEVAYAVAEGLVSIPVEGGPFLRNNIIIWDCSDSHLTSRGGYAIYDGSDPDTVRCFGTTHSGYGYDYDAEFQVQGKTVAPSSLLTTHCHYLINLGVLKDHSMAGVTLGMKNHLGSINAPGNCHGIDPDIPELNDEFRNRFQNPSGFPKEKIVIIDALAGVANGGPTGVPTFTYGGIILGTDIVAVDYQGRSVLQANGWDGSPAATYIETADDTYGLGAANPAEMDVVVHDPITPATREHVDKMIRFHKQGLATALQVEWAVNRYARGK
ncbi:DUF362 domain-containing protein [Candidatus Zixiibacteriota bacterium]